MQSLQCKNVSRRIWEHTFAATIKQETPEALEKLPSSILGTIGGGKIAIDPSDTRGRGQLESNISSTFDELKR